MTTPCRVDVGPTAFSDVVSGRRLLAGVVLAAAMAVVLGAAAWFGLDARAGVGPALGYRSQHRAHHHVPGDLCARSGDRLVEQAAGGFGVEPLSRPTPDCGPAIGREATAGSAHLVGPGVWSRRVSCPGSA
jgi:hypothetical protein